MMEINEHYWRSHLLFSLGYAWRGRFVEAREAAERAFQLAPWNPLIMGNLAGILACLGEQDRADELLAKIPETAPDGRVTYHLLCSEIDAAADWYDSVAKHAKPQPLPA